jgi:CysZ protein
MSYDPPDLASLGAAQRLGWGLRYAWWGVRLVLTETSLWPYVAAPLLITVLLFAGFGTVAWLGIGLAMDQVWSPGPHAATWVSVGWVALGLVLRAFALLAVGVALYLVAGLLATPFVDKLSEQVESRVLGPYDEPFSVRVLLGDLAQSVAHTALSMLLWLALMGAAFTLNVLPVAGQVLSFLAGLLATAFLVSRESMDGPLSRRRMSYGHKLRLLARHPLLTLGFGLAASALLWVPFLNLLVLPMTAAGGTLLFCHLEQQDLVPPARGQPRWIPNRHRTLTDAAAE